MLSFALRRMVAAVLVLVAISIMVFLIFFATPGVDPAARIAGRNADQATLTQVRHEFGLDRPLPVQYGKWDTAYARYRLWRAEGRWQRIIDALGPDAPRPTPSLPVFSCGGEVSL